MESLPIASLLVRITKAVQQGTKVLSVTKVPPIHWNELGLIIPAPAYETEAFNTSLFKVNRTQVEIFEFSRKRKDIKVKALL